MNFAVKMLPRNVNVIAIWKPLLVVFLLQEFIFVTEYIQDYYHYVGTYQMSKDERDGGLVDDVPTLPTMTPELSETDYDTKIKKESLKLPPEVYLARMYDDFKSRIHKFNCAKVIQRPKHDIDFSTVKIDRPDSNFALVMQLKHSCDKFIKTRGYIMDSVTYEEQTFPIAFSFNVYKDFHMVEAIMRVIYRPQNFYCLHVDAAAKTNTIMAARNFADCFPNVFVPRDIVKVEPQSMSVLSAEIICMYEMLKYKWKYYITLTENDFPLKTHRQIVKVLTSFRGANDIYTKPRNAQGAKFKQRFSTRVSPPHDINVVRGSRHIVASRKFVEFITSDNRVRDFITYLNGTINPGETFYTSLNNHKPFAAPGGFRGTLKEACNKPWIGRSRSEQTPNYTCPGKEAKGFCYLGVDDLPRLVDGPELFANQFYWKYQPIAISCLREWIINQTRKDYANELQDKYDDAFYSKLPQVLKRTRVLA